MQPIFDDSWRLRAIQGNQAAVQTMLQQVLQPLYGFCLYRVGKNQHWCEEVVQETMLRETNADILWQRAQNLMRLGQSDQARQLYRQLADGQWQERFNAIVEQARNLATP